MSRKKSTIKLPQTIRISEASKLLGVSSMTLRRWDEKGLLKAVRFGTRKDRRYKKEDILKVLQEGLE